MRDFANIAEQEQHLLYALALMSGQYMGQEHDDQVVLDHMCMGAGEEAFKALQAYGLIDVDGRGAVWTKKGLELLDLPLNQQDFPQ